MFAEHTHLGPNIIHAGYLQLNLQQRVGNKFYGFHYIEIFSKTLAYMENQSLLQEV